MPLNNSCYTLRRFAVALITCFFTNACSDTTVGTKSFTETGNFTVPGIPLSLGSLSTSFNLPVDLASQESYSDGDFDYVTSVKVRDIVFNIAESSNDAATDQFEDGNLDTFEFVSSLNLALQATVDGTLQTVQIADLPMSDPQIASNTSTLTLNVESEQDIRDLIEAPGGAVIVVSVSGTNPPDFVDIDATIRFRVGVGFR